MLVYLIVFKLELMDLTSIEQVIPPKLLLYILKSENYGVEYQPIIALDTLEIFAYEALSRFYDDQSNAIPPDQVYKALHDNPLSLFQVEYAQKKLQLQHAPKNIKLFVNLDQDSYFAYGDDIADLSIVTKQLNPFIQLFLDHKDNEVVVELIENSEIIDAKMSINMIKLMASYNIRTAIDDVCNEQSMLSTAVLEQVNFIKFDRFVVLNQHNAQFLLLIRALIAYARAAGKKTILEGVETEGDLLFAKSLNIDYVQGFLFKPQFLFIHKT
ncbi:diguanylate phosphodiesterase [Moritella sp. F3]|nr:diguanylate phosphodiesterase [Moritella sp. F1]GIC81392.1 diguanylate phosphodiesterase [Moritella sp. F3]